MISAKRVQQTAQGQHPFLLINAPVYLLSDSMFHKTFLRVRNRVQYASDKVFLALLIALADMLLPLPCAWPFQTSKASASLSVPEFPDGQSAAPHSAQRIQADE